LNLKNINEFKNSLDSLEFNIVARVDASSLDRHGIKLHVSSTMTGLLLYGGIAKKLIFLYKPEIATL
jgi:hypothetical protein